MAVKIVADSTAYIPKELLEKYDISLMSLSVVLNGISRREVEISNETFYKEMAQAKDFPTSSQPMIEEVLEIYREILSHGHSILTICMSSELSGTYGSTLLIRDMVLEEFPHGEIEVVDSKASCMQIGLAVIEAAKAAQEGKDLEECLYVTRQVLENSRFLFTPGTLEYLKKGGRIGGASALLGEILQIKPILHVVDGKTAILKKVRTLKKAHEQLIEVILADLSDSKLGDIIVHHINYEDQAKIIAEKLSESLDMKIPVLPIGPVVGTHVGPGTIGIAYYKKN